MSKKCAADLVIDALRDVYFNYSYAAARHQDPVQSDEENRRMIRRCHLQLELLISIIRKMDMIEGQCKRVKKILRNSDIIVEGEKLCDFAKKLCISGEIEEGIVHLKALSTAEIIEKVRRYQDIDIFHPLTCGNDSNHALLVAEDHGGKVVLVCPDCDYVQGHIPENIVNANYDKLDKLFGRK